MIHWEQRDLCRQRQHEANDDIGRGHDVDILGIELDEPGRGPARSAPIMVVSELPNESSMTSQR